MRFPIILVSPHRPENVGAAARAMKTMGFDELRIVNSKVHLEAAARWVAHGAGAILESASHWNSLAEALADIDFSVAATARSRAKFHYTTTPTQLLTLLEEKQQWVGSAALVFGREDTGLTNEELELVDVLTGVPMAANYPSLNLGQAVMVYCYQLSGLRQVSVTKAMPADVPQLNRLRQRLDRLLISLAVNDDRKMVDWLTQRIGLLTQRDCAMLHRLVQDLEKKLIDKETDKNYHGSGSDY